MNKLTLIVASVAVLAIGVASIVVANTASAATPCVVAKASGFTVNADKTITGTFKVTGDADCTQPVSVMTWNADPALNPSDEFFTSQTVHAVTTKTLGVGTHSLTVALPVCESDPSVVRGYQADIIAGANPATYITAPGTPGYYWETQADGSMRVIDWKLGDDDCPEVPEKGTTSVVESDLGKPTELANTGPGSTVAMSIAATIAGVLGYSFVQRKRTIRS